MPITLDDNLALLLLQHFLTGKPAPSGTGLAILGVVQQNQKLLGQITERLDSMTNTAAQNTADFNAELAGIQADMAKQTTVTNSVLVFVSGIKDKLAEALAQPDPAQALAAIKTIHAELNTNTDALVSATTENTTAQSEAPAPVEATTTVDPASVGTAPASDSSAQAAAPASDSSAQATTTGSDVGTATVEDSGTQPPPA